MFEEHSNVPKTWSKKSERNRTGGPNGIRTRVPTSPRAFASESTTCGVLSQRGSGGDGKSRTTAERPKCDPLAFVDLGYAGPRTAAFVELDDRSPSRI